MKRSRQAWVGGASVLALFWGGLPFAAAETLTDSVKTALASNPTVESTVHNRQSIDSEVRRARGLYLPQFDVRAGVGPEYSENSLIAFQRGSSRHIRQELSAVLAERIWDGGEADAEVDRQLGRSKSASFRVRESAEFTALDAVEGHLDVVRLRRILKISEDNVAVHRALLDRVERRAGGGAGRAADVAQAQSRLEDATSALEETRGLLREAEARYRNVVGTPPGTLEDATVPRAALPTDEDASIKLAMEHNPTIAIKDADITAARAEVDSATSRYKPKLSFELSGNHDRNVNGFPGGDNEARALLVLRWNLYAGGSDQANRQAAIGRVAQAKDDWMVAMRKAEQDTRRAWANYDAAEKRVAQLQNAVRHNDEVRKAYDQQFQVGQRSLLDLLDAQNEYFSSQVRWVTAQETAVFAAHRILALDGMLLATLDVPPPPEADYTKRAVVPADAGK